jgi:hypothetical protein
MTYFSEGDRVVLRFGKRQGQKGIIMESQPENVYKVKAEDGFVLFFSWKGIAKESEGVRRAVSLGRARPTGMSPLAK